MSPKRATVLLAAAAGASNLLGLAFTVVLARALGTDDYGSLAALISAFLVVSIAGSALQITVAREVSLEAEHHDPAIMRHVRGWLYGLLSITLVAAILGVLLRQPIANLVGVSGDAWGAAAVLGSGAAWLMLSTMRGVLQGLERFGWLASSIAGEAALRLLFAVIFVSAGGGVSGGFLGSGVSVLAMAAILSFPLRDSLRSATDPAGPRDASPHGLARLALRSWPALLALTLIALLQNSDVIMVKREALESIAGAYAANAVAAKVIVWIAIGLGFWVVPETARRGAGAGAMRVLFRVLGLIGVAGVAMIAVYAAASTTILKLAFGPGFDAAASSLPVLAAAMVMLSMNYLICQHFLALGRRAFLALLAVAVVVQVSVLTAVADSPSETSLALLIINLTAFAGLFGLAARKGGASPPASIPADGDLND